MGIVDSLREAGVSVQQVAAASAGVAGADAILAVEVNGVRADFAATVKSRAPYPGELAGLERMRAALAEHCAPLLVVRFVSLPGGEALTRAGWSWADEYGNFDLRARGLVVRQRRTSSPPERRLRTLPAGSGSNAVIRCLISRPMDDIEAGTTAMAAQAGVSQPRASQVLRRLHSLGLVDRAGHGRWRPRREELLDRLLAEYPGPGGSESYFYTLDPLIEVAARLTPGPPRRHDIAVSADVGPDLIRPWRRPSVLVLYTRTVLDAAALGSVDAVGTHDANVIVRMPADQSVFGAGGLAATFKGAKIPLADPVQMIWDLENLGGTDRAESAERLRQWLLDR